VDILGPNGRTTGLRLQSDLRRIALDSTQRRRYAPLAALALLAGTAFPVTLLAAEGEGGQAPPLSVGVSKGQRSLRLGDITVRQTGASIVNQRAITFAGSRTVVMVWDEYAGAQKSSWFALSLDGGRSVAQVTETPNVVRLRYATFDPLTGTPAIPEELKAGPENELFLVQFVSTPVEEMRGEVRAAGGNILWFLTENTHLVRMTPEARAKVATLPSVRWIGPCHPAYRVDEETRARIVAGEPIDGRFSISVNTVGPFEQELLAAVIGKMGGTVHLLTREQYRTEATINREQLLALLHRNEVGFIDPMGPMEEDMDLVRQMGGAVPLLSGAGFLGQGVRGEVFDGGCLLNHQQWNGQAPLVRTTNVTDAHGTACYGINFGTGTGNAQATGLLPMREQGMISRYQDTNQSGLGTGTNSRFSLNQAAVNPALQWRSCYQTSSVGSPRVTTYTTVSQEVDDYLFRIDYLSFQSQSNAGTRDSRPQAWAKNIISIGGIDPKETATLSDDDRSTGASVGPSADLRVKPDLAHSYGIINGTSSGGVFTTYTTGTTSYGQFNGTSSATPIAAGHGGLLLQMWHQGVWTINGVPTGGAATVFDSRPKSTTAKALLINGAYRYPINPATNPDNNMYRGYVGWGLPSLISLYNDRAKFKIVNADDPLTNAQVRSYQLTVGAGEPEFRATMVYPDPAPTTLAGQNRVNDLTLKVTDPNSVIYWGNNGMVPTGISVPGQIAGANYSTPGGSANTYDPVENVFVQNPTAGTWTVEIIASQVVADGYLATPAIDAVYSLVVSNVTLGPAPCYANCDGSTDAPILNVADFTCFLNKYAAGDAFANCDGSTTAPVLNVADFTCFLNQYSAGCP
jgi:serine protease AprX